MADSSAPVAGEPVESERETYSNLKWGGGNIIINNMYYYPDKIKENPPIYYWEKSGISLTVQQNSIQTYQCKILCFSDVPRRYDTIYSIRVGNPSWINIDNSTGIVTIQPGDNTTAGSYKAYITGNVYDYDYGDIIHLQSDFSITINVRETLKELIEDDELK